MGSTAQRQPKNGWLHPEVVQKWLAGVNTFDGGDAVAAVNAALRS
jgi:hypothetical protein